MGIMVAVLTVCLCCLCCRAVARKVCCKTELKTIEDVTFQPGEELGCKIDKHSGRVETVEEDKSAHSKGIREGWSVTQIDKAPFSIKLLQKKSQGKAAYVVRFITPGD